MTTIAYCNGELAADSRTCSNSMIITDTTNKLNKLVGVSYKDDILLWMGSAGSCSDIEKVVAYLHSEDFPYGQITHESWAIIVGKKRLYKLEENTGWLISYDKHTKLAMGSGQPFAMSAMGLGLTAKEAVKHAIKFDCYSGGKVRSIKT